LPPPHLINENNVLENVPELEKRRYRRHRLVKAPAPTPVDANGVGHARISSLQCGKEIVNKVKTESGG